MQARGQIFVDSPFNFPSKRRTKGFIGKLHFQWYVLLIERHICIYCFAFLVVYSKCNNYYVKQSYPGSFFFRDIVNVAFFIVCCSCHEASLFAMPRWFVRLFFLLIVSLSVCQSMLVSVCVVSVCLSSRRHHHDHWLFDFYTRSLSMLNLPPPSLIRSPNHKRPILD